MKKAGVFTSIGLTLRHTVSAAGFAPSKRLSHALWASLIALLLAFTHTLEPLDRSAWVLQSRLSNRAPSGQIVFVQVDANVTDPDVPVKRMELAELVSQVRDSGAASLYLDLLFDQPSTSRADGNLRAATAEWGSRLRFVNRIDVALAGSGKEMRSIEAVAGGNAKVWMGITSEWPNTVFELPHSYLTSEGIKQSFASAMAGPHFDADPFQVEYGFSRRSIQRRSASALKGMSRSERLAFLRGKIVVVSTADGATASEFRVPNQYAAPPSYVAIYGAETLRDGGLFFVPGVLVTGLAAVLLCCLSMVRRNRRRSWLYSILVFAIALAFLSSNKYGVRIELSCAIAATLIYFGFRSRARWQDHAANIDPDTGLPTIRALTSEIVSQKASPGHVVIGKIHGFENILKTLDTTQRAAYICKLSERLRIGNPRLAIYVDGQYLAWQVDEDDQAKMFGHLEGLRAIFAAPVVLGEHAIDVGITFGAALLTPDNRDHCIAAALAAAEETSEALEPVKIAVASQPVDTLWDLSLRARIDAAMEAGEVFCVYQPKMDIAADRLVGVEALVRWEDPERGFIPPMHFVMQCEKAGRMEYLTRYVLQSACSAAKLLHFRGNRITMSVNISATLLTDMRIVGIVRNVLQATGFDANYLVLEITETARIRDLTQARSVLKALKALGTHLSMDDFGVGAANFEALQALPFDEIKIDRQFVSRASSSTKARAITASIVGLGTSARIAVVAEGAETPSDLQMLREIGCWQVQGYALARPMPLTNLLSFIDSECEAAESAAI